jgi:hypothetical protein
MGKWLEMLNKKTEISPGEPLTKLTTRGVVEQGAVKAIPMVEKRSDDIEDAYNLRMSDLFREGPIRRVKSRVLNEDVLFVADGAEVPANNELVVYLESELRLVIGMSPELLRAVHLTKKVFDGLLEGESAEHSENVIWAHELIGDIQETISDACRVCFHDKWWAKADGERVCGVCHPQPKPHGMALPDSQHQLKGKRSEEYVGSY